MTPPGTTTGSDTLIFGNYEILDTTGSGGMGVVYRAMDLQLGRPVALKVLRDDLRTQQHIVARFQREAEAIATLNHPNIVHVYSVGIVGRVPYLAMEFIEGTTLGNILAEHGPMSWPEALDIAAQIAEALASAHDSGIIHRDIKPGNILIDHAGKVFVTDFGIAKVLSATTKLTVDGSRLGTPQYMSPERCKNKEVTPSSDIYSLGVLLYQSICGHLPYEANSPVELVAKITGEDPVRITEYAPDLPENIDHLLAHMLDPNPKARPQSAPALLALIDRVRKGQPLVEGGDTASKALQNYRSHFERESAFRTPEPKTEKLHVPWNLRLSQAWFALSRGARLAAAIAALVAISGALGVGAWRVARSAAPAASFVAMSTDTEAWSAPATPYTVTQESRGVSIVHLALPFMTATRVLSIAGTNNLAVELSGQPNTAARGQYAIAQIFADPLAAELILSPTPTIKTGTTLLAIASMESSGPAFVFSNATQTTTLEHGPKLPPNAVVAQPLGTTGQWAVARFQAGQWQIEVVDATGHTILTLPVPQGPITALAVAPGGASALVVTGSADKGVLWNLALTAGAVPKEIAHGNIALSPQAFTPDGLNFVVAVQEPSASTPEVRQYPLNGGAPLVLGPGIYAANSPTSATILFLAPDRTDHNQLWRVTSTNTDPTQLTFLGAGLGDTFTVTTSESIAAPVNSQPAIAIVALSSLSN